MQRLYLCFQGLELLHLAIQKIAGQRHFFCDALRMAIRVRGLTSLFLAALLAAAGCVSAPTIDTLLTDRLPKSAGAAGGVANCSCARSPERPPRTRAPRGGDHSVSEVARWSHVLRNLARGAADVRPPEPGVAGDARGSRGSRA